MSSASDGKRKLAATLFLVTALLFFLACLIAFMASDDTMALVWFSLGCTFLAVGVSQQRSGKRR